MEAKASIDELTRQLQQLWQSVLATEQAVKPEDDFFQLGGTWTTVVELALRASKQGKWFGVEDVYECPRLCDLVHRAFVNSNSSMVNGFAINNTDEDPSSSFPPGSFPSEESTWQTCEMEPQALWHPTCRSTAPTTLLRASWALLQGKYEGAASVAFKTADSEGPMVPFVSSWNIGRRIEEFLNSVQQSGKALGGAPPPPSLSTGQEIRSGMRVTTVLDAGNHDNVCDKIRATSPSLALEIHCILSADRISLVGGSWKGVMSGPALHRTLEQLQHTIQQVATCRPDDVLRSLQLMSPGDRQQLLEWNRRLPAEVTACVHEQFDASVQRWADDIVIDAWDGVLRYRELDELSSRLAHHLVGLGIGREKVVGVNFEKSKWAVVCMLAILKAGGACLFLDPRAPRARRESLLRDAGAALLLISPPANIDSAGDGFPPSLVIDHPFIDALPPSQSSEIRGARRSSPSDAAFIVFSSGSTGKPKASVIEHRSVCTLARYRGQLLSQGPSTRLLQWPTYTFDVAYGEMVMVLLNGGCICIASDEDRVNNLEQAIRHFDANSIYMTPSALDMLTPENVPSLKSLTVGGEPLTSTIVQKWAHQTDLKVTYGPSECTVASVGLSHVDSDTPAGSIGYGVGARTWVVDPDNNSSLAAIGTVGELWLEGPKLARGYMDAALDEGVFLNVPPFLRELDPSDKVRLYRTGDMVRYLPGGALQFLGRMDTQVKIRGQRVELDEINFHLADALPQGSQAAVLVVTPQDEARPLLVTAIYMESHGRDQGPARVLEAGETPEGFSHMISGVAEKLRSILPAYMIPSAFLPLSRLPKTVSGKLDHASLRACCQRLTRARLVAFWSDSAAQPATTPTEHLLVSAWADVLGCEEGGLGADSDFLRLGGDSLHAILLVSVLGKRGVRLTVQRVFENSQLAKMAADIDAGNVEDEHPESQLVEPFSMCPDTLEIVRRAMEEQSGMPAGSIEDAYPCSPLQAGMMALSLTEPRSYLSQNTFYTPPGGDPAKFRAAWDVMFQRSPILRTRIVLLREEMLQVVVHEDHIPWQAVDDLDSYLEADLQTPTILGQPLVRFACAGDAVSLTIHHALSDGWSKAALLEDVERVYRGLDPNPHLPYSTFIRHVQAIDRSAAVKFWSQRLRQAPPITFPALPSPGYRPYADQLLQTAVMLPSRAPSSGFTLATLVRTAWGLIMARYGATTDAIFGETVTGRAMPLQGIESVEGPTIATVPVRVSFEHNQTVHSLLEAVQRDATEMIPYEQLGLQAISRVSGEARQACAFQSMLVIQNYEHRPVHDKGETPRLMARRHRINLSHLLTVNVTPTGSEMEFLARFDGEVLQAHQVRRILQQTQHVLAQLWRVGPETTIHDIELMSPEDRRDIARWNDYPVEAAETSLPTLIAQRASTQPDAPAVRAWDGEMTYAELLRLSANLAGHLRERGVVRGQAIPVCFEKSAWTVVVMLAILRSGAMVVPLDAKHPVGRIATIVEASAAKLMVASTLQAPRFRDQNWEVLPLSPTHIQALDAPIDPLPTITADDVALIMFTSGSTGVPKGIVMDHRCLCSSIVTHSAVLRVPPRINVLQYSAYTFDHSIFEIYTTLITGGCVCVLSDDERMNSLVESMRRYEINWVYFTPSIAKLIHVQDVPTLSTLYVGGELVPRSLVDEWAPMKTMINAYGPAECSMMSSCVMTPSSPAGTIGKPQAGRTWIVDADDFDRLAPVGVIGEMVYEGPMVAKGYLHETPSSGFIRRPKWASPDTPFRFYRTGDLGRYEPDGSLVFAGRKDTQIKLRGQRVEPGEVESQMHKLLPDTLLAVEVVIPADGDGTPSLTAFLDVNGAAPSTNDDASQEPAGLINGSPEAKRRISSLIHGLEEALLRTLPEYMVPTVFLPVRALPMTTSGKVDRKMLRQLGKTLTVARLASLSTAAEHSPPATDAEVTLQALWAAVLGMDKAAISADNSFLRLGGDSITAIRLVRAAREAGFRLDVEHVFRHPVLHEMASSMRPLDLADEKTAPPVLPFSLLAGLAGPVVARAAEQCGVDAGSIEDVYPCTAMQSGLMLLSAREPGTYVQQTVYRLSRPLADFLAAWSALVALTPLLRTSIMEHNSHHLQVVLRDLPAVRTIDHIDEDFLETERQQLGPGRVLSRLAVCKSPDSNTARVVFTIHHAVYDGWSQALLMERLQTLLRGRPVAPSPPFTNFIAHLESTSASEAELYWRMQLAGAELVSFPELPSLGYRPRPMSVLDHNIVSRRVLGSDFTEPTRIRAAWALLVSRYLDQQLVTLGITVNGRGSGGVAGIDRILGPMLTTVPVTVDTARTALVSDYLMAVQQQAIEMQAHEQYGLQRIAALDDKMRAICDFHSLLVIHHKGSEPQDQAQPFWEPESHPITRPFHAFALSMECTVQRDGVGIHATYDKDVIDPRAMMRIVFQFEHILRQLGDPDLLSSSVGDIELISPADLAELATWNAVVPAPTMACIHHLVEDQVKQRPESPAVASWEGELTFRQLDTLASSLAEHLRETANIGPKILVPLVFEKSIYTVVTMLAVMKAGGACVALDPAHPTDRLLGILEDIKASVVLSSVASLAKAQQLQLPVVAVDRALLDRLVTSPLRLPPSTVGPEDPAIILFTSGSTGKPKGIVIDHRAFCSSIRGHGETLRYRAGSRNLQFTAYTSDVSYGEMFTSLSRGACVCIPSDHERMNDLAGAIERLRVDWAFLTPSVASLLDPKTVPTLRTLLFGGETATPENIQTWADAVYLINSFGPAECSIWNCCNPGISTKDIGSNIGKGLGCAQWIVEPGDDSRLAPIGTVGELVVEGPNLAKGYLGLPDKTKAVFIDGRPYVPEERRAASRLYKTGDLARFMPDGNVQFIGRRDAQVKLHGQRLELGEVEHQLRRYLPSHLTEVAAEMVRPAGGPPLLAAFANIRPMLTDEAIAELDGGELAMSGAALDWLSRHFPGLEAALAERLPRFMIPSLLVPLTRMPLSGSAKTDRGRLRKIAQDMTSEQVARLQACRIVKHVAPANDRERRLQALWAAVLDVSLANIGRSDRFFHLGGNSIRAMRLVTLAREHGLGLSVKDIFDHPQLSAMAAATHDLDPEATQPVRPFSLLQDAALEEGSDDLQADAAQQCGVAIDHVVDLYPCTPLQAGLMAQSLKQPGTYIGRFAHQVPADIDMERFRNAWRTVIREEALLRTRMVQSSVGLLQAIMSSEIDVDWAVVQTAEEFVGQTTAMELGRPLARFGIVESQRVFLLTLHHALYDAWSLDLLFQKARSICEGHQVEEAPTAFNHFIQHLQKQDQKAARTFWANQLAAAPVPSFPRLPSAQYSPSTDSLITLDVALPASPRSGTLPSTIITASWATVVGRQSDTFDDALFGVTYSGRSAPVAGIERIAGPTMATVPFRMPLDRDQRVESFLADVQRQATAVSAYEQYGLPQIRAICEHAVAFQSLLVIQAAAPSSEEAWLQPAISDDGDGQQAFHNFALSVECTIQGDGVHIVCNFDSHVLPERQARRVMGQFAHVLEQLVCPSPSLRLGDVQVISPADQAEMEEWNDGVPEPDNRLVHQLVQVVASVQPKALAIVSWDRNFTYAQLDDASSALAGALVARGVTAGQRVPILFEKSSWAIVAMLAILRAGCACVALDPAQSPDRLRSAVSRLQATVVMASDRHYSLAEDVVAGNNDDVDDASNIDIIPVGPAHRGGWKAFPAVMACPATPQDPAFLFLQPVSKHQTKETETIIRHATICSSIRGHGEVLRFSRGPESRNLQFAAYTSTSSIGEIFTSLALGACVCVPSDEERMHNLAGAIDRMQADWAILTPSVASMLSPATVPTLRTLVFGGGETPTRQNLQDWAGSVCLINSYGPAGWPGWTHCTPEVSGDDDASDIGRQMKHCRTWITDPDDPEQLAPIGAAGELLIEDPGYDTLVLDNGEEEENKKARFVAGPRWIRQAPEQRRVFFRTGHLARFRPDGSVQLVGRRNMQVKLRGRHVDIGEVEQRLREELPALRELAVEIVRPASAEAPLTLAAFFNMSSYLGMPAPMKHESSSKPSSYLSAVAHSPAAKRASAKLLEGLASRLALMLPAHAIPSIYVPLWAMPLSESATVDREALKALALELPASEIPSLTLTTSRTAKANDDADAAIQPLTSLERRLARLWSQVLGVDNIAADDHFISRGGDSLAAMRLVRDAQKEGLELSVTTIFQHPTLRAMAAVAVGNITSAEPEERAAVSDNDMVGNDDNLPAAFSLLPVKVEQVPTLVTRAAELLHVNEASIQDVLPCSPLQEGLMALSLQQPGSYMAHFVYQLPLTVDPARFQAAWQATLDSSLILRTRIVQLASTGLVQIVLRSALTEWEHASDLQTCLAKAHRTTMTMGDPLVRLALVSGSDDELRFVLTIHHAIYDERSLQLLWASVRAAYSGFALPRRTPFSSFIRHIQATDSDMTVAFWTQQLQDTPAPSFPKLPSTAPSFQARPDKNIQTTVPLPRLQGLRVTPAVLVRAAFALWLARHTASDDVVFGTTMSGRAGQLPGVDLVDGPTIATMPVRVLCRHDQSVANYLQQVQQQAIDMMPFEQTGLQNIRRLSEGAQAACNFRVLLVVQAGLTPAAEEPHESELDCPLLPVGTADAVFHTHPLIVGYTLMPDSQLRIQVLYDSRVLVRTEAERMLRQSQHLIQQLASAPDNLPVDDILAAALPPDELATIRRWNSRPLPTASIMCLPTQLAELSRDRIQQPAVTGYDGQYTHEELINRARVVARHLVEVGVHAGNLVPICFERSSWAIVAMLGVWLAGAAFVPLDASQPSARLQDVITQASARLALVSPITRATIEPLLPVLELSEASWEQQQRSSPTTDALPTPSPHDLAYVLFTSGSTGRPKGVVIDHQTLYVSISGMPEPMGLGPHTRFLQQTSYTFDISVVEIFSTLLAGGCVCVARPGVERIGAAMEAMGVNTACFTPSLVQHLRPEQVPSLRTLILGGEAIKPVHIETWASRVALFNGYGLTETCILATLRRIPPPATSGGDDGISGGIEEANVAYISDMSNTRATSSDEDEDEEDNDNTSTNSADTSNTSNTTTTSNDSIDKNNATNHDANNSIGTAVSCHTWIVDPNNHRHLVPLGALGELLVSGPILAREYLHDAARTASAFIRVPELGPGRFFRTGDLVRYGPDGSIHYLGRGDTTVKLRGQRIDLAEIELRVRQAMPEVAALAAVMVKRNETPALAVFFRPRSEASSADGVDHDKTITNTNTKLARMTPTQAIDCRSTQVTVARYLPAVMVPSLWVPISSMPVTRAGKLNTALLQQLLDDASEDERLHYALATTSGVSSDRPATAMEQALQAIWVETLGLNLDPARIGPDDSFFRLGGESLSAIRLVAVAEDAGLCLSTQDVFNAPTLTEMARIARPLDGDVETDDDVIPFSLIPSVGHRDAVLEASRQCHVLPDEVVDIYPSTPLQDGLLVLSAKQPGTYITSFAFSLPDSIQLPQYRASWVQVIAQLPSLRTRVMHTADGGFRQVVLKSEMHWTEHAAAELDAGLALERKSMAQIIGRPLTRYAVIQTSDLKRFFVWTAHHCIYDAWTVPKIISLVEQTYLKLTAAKTTTTPAPATSPIPFNRFIRHLHNQDSAHIAQYWREQLDGVPSPSFPALSSVDHRPVANAVLNHVVTLDPSQRVSNDITMATKIRAAWSLLLSLYENSRDVVFGATLGGRNTPVAGINSIMGPTIATVPIRMRLPNTSTPVGEWLQAVQQQAVEMIPFEQVGLQQIQKLHQHARAAVDFRSLLLVQSGDGAATQSRLGIEQLDGEPDSFYTYPLVMSCTLHDSGVDITANYDDSLLDVDQVDRLVRQFDHILRQLHKTLLDIPLSHLNTLPELDAQQIAQWNAAPIPVVDSLVHREVLRMVQQQPGRPAVASWDGNLSYAELEVQSRRFARHLQLEYGIGPEDKVPFCLDKSRWAVVAILGIMRAGGVAVPLNPAHPPAHRGRILDQLQPKAIVTTIDHTVLFPDHPVILLSSTKDELNIPPRTHGAIGDNSVDDTERLRFNNAAFIVFTSGTTGTPKGIVLEHRSICTSSRSHGKLMKVTPTSRVLQFAAYVFDASIADIFTTLIHGGCVCIPSEHDRLNDLAGAIVSLDVTHACLTATVASHLRPDQVPSLQVLSVGGEPLTKHVVSTWAPCVHLINIYGPAECTIWCAGTHVVDASARNGNIGHGVGSHLWLVNPADHNLLVPIGAVGEIVIDGPLLARGYLNNPDKTAASFIQEAPWLPHGRRAYKSGDLGRYMADGTIECLNRQDGQVKLHGQRMELEAVEHHLRACLSVDRPVAAAVLSVSSHQVLAGFVSLSHRGDSSRILQDADSADQLSRLLSNVSDALASRLPQYMVPTVFLPIATIPTSLSGKIDRRTLQALGNDLKAEDVQSLSPHRESKQAPATATEETLQRLWASILQLSPESIGRNDNFLRLGGDSIASMRLVAAAREADLHLTVADVFDRPILSDMAHNMTPISFDDGRLLPPFALTPEGNKLERLREDVTRLCQVDSDMIQDIYPCTPTQHHYIKLSTSTPGCTTLQNVYIIPPEVDVGRLRRAWEQVVAANALLRTRVILDPETDDSWQVVLNEPPVWRSAANLEAYYAQEVAEPMGPGSALSRCAIVDGQYFVWTCNHAIYDAWTVGLVMSQLEQAYQGQSLGPEAPFALFVQHLLATDDLEADRFWQQTLQDCQAQSLCGSGSAQVDSLLVLEMALPTRSQATQITMPTIVQVALAIMLASETGQHDVVLGLTVAGRDTSVAGIDRMTGPTIATIPLRLKVDPKESLDGLLRTTQALVRATIPFQHVGMPHIRQLSESSARACDATVPVVINAANHHKAALGSSIGLERSRRTPLAESPLPFFLDCSVDKETLDVYATFDSHVLPRARVQTMMARFASVLRQLCSTDGKTVGDLDVEDCIGDGSDATLTLHETHSGVSFDPRTKETASMTQVNGVH